MSEIRSTYHISLNNNGFMLRGAPETPLYQKQDAPTVVNQLGIGDLDYNKLNGSGWSYWTQTDWSGGFQQLKYKDTATFKSGQAVDTIKKYGEVSLQNKFTSAAVISGSHSYGDSIVHGDKYLIGTVKGGGAKLLSLTSASTVATISAMTGISAVNIMTRFNDNTIVGMTRPSGTVKTLSKYNGSTLSGFRNANPTVRSANGIGVRLYTGERVSSLSGDVLYYTTDLSTFTSAYQAGKDREITHIDDLNGAPYFFIKEDKTLELLRWDEFAERAYPLYKWKDFTDFGITRYLTYIIITGKSSGKKTAYAFNGAYLRPIFEDQLDDDTYDFTKPFEYKNNLQTKGTTWDGEFWFPGIYDKYHTVQYTPVASFTNRVYGYAITGSNMVVGYSDSSKYAISGHIVSSEFGHNIAGVDKLVNTAVINCKALANNETIELLRSTDGGENFTSIGTLSKTSDGAITNKILNFPSGFVTKLWNYKTQLAGPGTTTPTFLDVSFEYRPIPELKKRWGLSVDAGDNIKLLNGQNEARDGKALMGELWLEKETKRTVTYKDINAFDINMVSAMTAANTSARVEDTRLMPPKGRARITSGGVAEEITYTSADGTKIAGISRGQKETKARAYTSAQNIDNHYTVLVTDIKERVNNTDQNRTESFAQVTLLEV